MEYVLGLLLILVLVYYFTMGSSEYAVSWILNQPSPPSPPVTLPIAVADIPTIPELPLDTTVIAYPTYAESHLNHLKDSLKNKKGDTLRDQELEYKFLNPGI